MKNSLKIKQLQKGLAQLSEEGAVQVFRPLIGNDYILGAVGILQFDVTMARLKTEYGVEASYEQIDYAAARWIACDDKQRLAEFEKKCQANLARDADGHLTYLAASEWRLGFIMEEWPDIAFRKTREQMGSVNAELVGHRLATAKVDQPRENSPLVIGVAEVQ